MAQCLGLGNSASEGGARPAGLAQRGSAWICACAVEIARVSGQRGEVVGCWRGRGGGVVMVMISGYENFVSELDIDESKEKLNWLGTMDS